MKRIKKVVVALLVLGLSANSFAQTKKEKKEAKLAKSEAEYKALKSLVEPGSFRFDAENMSTAKGLHRNIQGDNYFLKVDDGNSEASLPYFGVAQSAGFGASSGIEFNTAIEDYGVTYDDKKRRAVIKMNVKTSDESLQVIITATGGISSVSVTSSRRNRISYDGKITALKTK